MAKELTEIEAKLTGAPQVVQEAQKIDSALDKVGATANKKLDKANKKLDKALKDVRRTVSKLATDGLRAAGVLQTINMANAVEDTKHLDLATAKLGQSAGVSGTLLRNNFDAVEKKTLTSSVAMAEFARSLGLATYDSKFAADSVGALGEEALAVGRDLGDELPLAAALRGTGIAAKDLPAELGRIRDMAEQVGTVGGHMALKDTLAALGPQLAGVSMQAPDARAKLEALIAVLGKGLKPEQAQAVGAAALQTIRSRALDIERVTGRRVLDDNNELVDPTQTLKDLKKLADRKFGTKNTEAKRRAMMNEFTPELGLAIFRTDFGEVGKLAASATDRGKTAAEADKFRQSKEGKRIEADLAKNQALRSAGSVFTGVHDTLVDTLGVKGALGVELVAGAIPLSVVKALGGKLLATKVGASLATTAGTLAVPAALGLGAAAVGAGVYYAAGENKKVEAQRAQERSTALLQGFNNVEAMQFHHARMGLDIATPSSEQAAVTEALLQQMTQLNATLKNQPAAYAEAMGRKVLKVAMPVNPNAPKGN